MSEEFQITIEPEENAHVIIETEAQLQSNDDNLKAVDIATLIPKSGHEIIETVLARNLQCHPVASSNTPSWHMPTITPVIPIEQQLQSFIQDDKSNFLSVERDRLVFDGSKTEEKVLGISHIFFEEELHAPTIPLLPEILPANDCDSGDTNIGGGVAYSEPGPSTSRVRLGRGRGVRTRGGGRGVVKAEVIGRRNCSPPSSAAANAAPSSAVFIPPIPEIVRRGRGRGVRTRGGGRGAVKAEVVAGDAAVAASAGAGQRRGTRRPRAVDGLNIGRNEDLPHDVPLETRLTKRRKRNCSLPSSTAADAAPSSAVSIPSITEMLSSAAADVASSSADSIPPIPEMFLECHEQSSIPVPPPRREQEAPRDDDFLINYGSEPESESDDELATPFVPRSQRFLMETPQDEDDDATLDSQAHTTVPATSSKPASLGPAMGPNFYDFEWRAFPNPPIEPELRRETFSNSNAGPTTPCVDPYDIFIAIWDRQIMEHIVSETNKYAQELAELLKSNNALQPKSRIREWRDTTTDELYTYLAIVLAMGNVVKPRIEAYWSTNPSIFCTPYFKAHMALRRFQLLSRCLHFNRNEDLRALNVGSSEAKIFKVKPVVTHLNKKFQQMYNLQQNLALDESLLQWKGWLSFNQHIPNKAAVIGLKTYEVCESQTGYLWRFEVHTCNQSRQADPSDPLDAFTPTIVLRLLQGLENRGHTVWMDNFYNSPALARKLKTLGFDCAGTLRTNRKFVPEVFHKLTKENMREGTIAGLTSGDVDVVVWRDKNRVATISTYHGNSVAERYGTIKPNLVFDYNIMMGGVDKKDQMLAMYPVERKRTMIWYKKIFRRLLNVSVLNAYIICKRSSSRIDHYDFRETLISSLLEKHCTGQVVSIQSPNRTPDSLSIRIHHLVELPLIGRQRQRRKCQVCKKRVHTYCAGCQKFACIACFVKLHDD